MNLKPKWSVEFYRLSYTHQWRNGNQVGREITEPVMVGLTPLHQQWYPHSTSMITKQQQIQQVCSYFTCTMVVLLLCCCCCWWVAVELLGGLTGCANVDVCPHENNKWQGNHSKKKFPYLWSTSKIFVFHKNWFSHHLYFSKMVTFTTMVFYVSAVTFLLIFSRNFYSSLQQFLRDRKWNGSVHKILVDFPSSSERTGVCNVCHAIEK